MNTALRACLIPFVLCSINGCSWLFGDEGTFRDRGNDYRKAKVEAPLEIPEHLDSDSIDDSYAIPQISDKTTLDEEFVVPAPEPLAEDIDRDSVRINTLNDQRWILVDGTPGQVWPRLRGFLSLNQLDVQRADAVNGIIETGWLQPSTEGALRERYRLRIDQGVQRSTSEIYVLQADIRAGEDNWPPYSSNTEREELITRELAQYLADSAAAAAVSMLAQQAIDSSGKVTLEQDKDDLYIKLTLPFNRAWASVGKAAEKAGFSIEDINISQRLYYLNYKEKVVDEERGFWSSLFSWGSKNKNSKDTGIAYLLRLKEQTPTSVLITIERQSGETIVKNEAEKLLKLIKRNLS